MQYRTLGRTGLSVSEIGVGGAQAAAVAGSFVFAQNFRHAILRSRGVRSRGVLSLGVLPPGYFYHKID